MQKADRYCGNGWFFDARPLKITKNLDFSWGCHEKVIKKEVRLSKNRSKNSVKRWFLEKLGFRGHQNIAYLLEGLLKVSGPVIC